MNNDYLLGAGYDPAVINEAFDVQMQFGRN